MFNCSKEEPVTNNESLYQRKSSDDILILDQSSGLLINRYGFVCKGCGADTAIPMLVKSLINHIAFKAFVVLCWLVQIPGKSKVASRVIEKRYEKKNWSIYKRNDHYVAIKEISFNDVKAWPPLGINPLDGGIILMLGDYDEVGVLGSISNNDSIFLARNRYFAPDFDFLTNLERTKILALYQVNDDLNNTGLVLTGDITIDMKAIGRKISISNIFEGESAYKLFV